MGFERVLTRKSFKHDLSNLSQYDQVLMFGFNNDIRDNEDDPNDLFDLKATFKKAINFPNSFDRNLYSVYQHILKAEKKDFKSVKEEILAHIELDSTLIEDEIVKQFLKNQNDDFFMGGKTKTAFLLRDYNFNLEVLPQIMKDLREIKKNDEILL